MPRSRRKLKPPRPPKPSLIEHDVHCVECGYNLRGLLRRTVCPECQTPIKRSLAGPLLRHAGSGWLTRIHRGLLLLHRASIIAAIAILALPVIDIFSQVYRNRSGPALSYEGIPLVLAAWSIASCAGLWLATSPTPRAEQRFCLQSTLERVALLAIPLNTLAWIALGMLATNVLSRFFGNPLGALGIGAFSPAYSRIALIVMVIITWLQSMLLARWLNRIDARVDHQVRRQPTLFDRINWALTRSHDNPPGASAEFSRGLAKWAPAALAGIMIFAAIGQKQFPWWPMPFIAFLPLMILLTLRRTVRDVGEERAIGNHIRQRESARPPS